MKLCKNCQHFRGPSAGLNVTEFGKCMYGRAESPVTGEHELKTQTYEYCISLRNSPKDTDCGPDGRFHEEFTQAGAQVTDEVLLNLATERMAMPA